MKKKIFLISVMALALISIFAISVFADELIASKTVSEEYGTVIQLTADPGLDNAKQYVSTLNKINDSGTDKDALCILTDGTYFYVFPSSYIVDEIKDGKNDGRFNVYTGTDTLPGIVQALNEFNTAMDTEYYAGYTTSGSGGGKKIDAVVRFVFPTDVTFIHKDYCCMRSYSNLVEVRFNHAMDFSRAGNAFQYSSKLKTVIGFEKADGTALDKAIFIGCSSLESVKLPTNIVRIPSSMFWGCGKIKIENLSECTQLTTIGEAAFRDSANLVFTLPDTVTTLEKEAFRAALKSGGSFTINETSQLQTIGVDAFNDCRCIGPSLYIPSSVTSIGVGAFCQAYGLKELVNLENCKITELAVNTFKSVTGLKSIKIPETVTTIGSAFVDTEKLATVYIPKTVTSIEDAFTGTQPSNALYIYTGNDASVLAECLRLKNANIIPASQYDETKSYTGINLVVGYSHCVAYYNGAHSSTVIDDIVTSYYETIDLVSRCVECGATEDAGQIPAFFICLGYSTPEDGRNGIAICFRVNNKAISLYKDATGKDVEYGIFAVAQSKLGKNDIFNNNGSKAEGVMDINISDRSLVEYDFILTGFTDANKDAKLAIGTYIAVTKGETTEYSYMQADKPCENEKYHFISYSDIVTSTLSEN